MSKTFKRQRKEDKPRSKYKRNKSNRDLTEIKHTTSTSEQDWNFRKDLDASDF